MLKMYRTICMSNVSVKLITKVINNRTIALAPKIIDPIQTTFIKNIFILFYMKLHVRFIEEI